MTADPLEGDVRIAEYFGDRYPAVAAFRAMLEREGERRGLLGPRESGRLWERHLLNSAAVAPFLPEGAVADVGSGAGLPGLVLASMFPDREILLIEPMERRAAWLGEASEELGLDGVRVIRARAEALADSVRVPAVTARAVAPLVRLSGWCAPLLADDGCLLFLKGRGAPDEVAAAEARLTRLGLRAEVLEAGTVAGLEPTRVVRLTRP